MKNAKVTPSSSCFYIKKSSTGVKTQFWGEKNFYFLTYFDGIFFHLICCHESFCLYVKIFSSSLSLKWKRSKWEKEFIFTWYGKFLFSSNFLMFIFKVISTKNCNRSYSSFRCQNDQWSSHVIVSSTLLCPGHYGGKQTIPSTLTQKCVQCLYVNNWWMIYTRIIEMAGSCISPIWDTKGSFLRL